MTKELALKLKPGMKLLCIDDSETDHAELKKGGIYTVINASPSHTFMDDAFIEIEIEEVQGYRFLNSRFELADEIGKILFGGKSE